MALEMKVPSPGESISEVEIAEWLVQDGDYVEKDQAVAEVDSDKATLELPAEAAGIITLKAEEGDVVEVGQVVCLIDTEAEKPSGDASDKKEDKSKDSDKKDSDKKEEASKEKKETSKEEKDTSSSKETEDKKETYATGSPSPAAKKTLDEKGIDAKDVKGTGRDGRITKYDAEQAEGKPAMGTPGN